MGLSKDYLKFLPAGICNLVGSPNGSVQFVDGVTCAVIAGEQVNFYNMRTLEKTYSVTREGKTVTAFRLSPDRSLVAIGYNDGELHVYKWNEQSQHSVFAGHRTGVNCLAFSSDGLILASGGKDSVIVVWDIVNEVGLCKFTGHKSSVTNMQFAQNDQFLVSSSKDMHIKFWSMASRSSFYTLAESSSEIYTFALIDQDRLLVVGNAEIELLVFELCWLNSADGELVQSGEENGESKKRRKSAQKPLAGSDLIENQVEQENQIFRCKKRGTLIRQAKGRALQLAVSSDETIVCCVGADSAMDIYRHFNEEESQKRYQKKLRKVRQRIELPKDGEAQKKLELEVSRDVTTLITRIGDFRADSKLKWVDICDSFTALENEKIREYRICILLKTNDVQGVALRIDWKSNATTAVPLVSIGQRVHRSDVRALAVAADDSFFVSGSNESAVIWEMDTLSVANKLTEEAMAQVSALIVVSDQKQLIVGTRSGSIFLFNLRSCELIETHERAHQSSISAMHTYPEKNGFLSCGSDKKTRFWHFEQFTEIDGRKRLTLKSKRILELPDEPLCAAISPNGKFVAFGLLDNTARVYYTDSLKFFVSLYGHSLPIYCIDISHDSKLVVTGSADKSAKIWGLDFGDCHKSLFAHDDTVTCVKFSTESVDERVFWTAGKDGKLKQWDANKFHRIQTLEGHSAEIDALALSHDGRTLISASRDKSIRLWELSDELIVLQEEEEREREKEYEQKLIDQEEIIPGESREAAEEDMAPLKSMETIKSTESIIEAIEIVRAERLEREKGPADQNVHPLLKQYPVGLEHLFLADVVQQIRHSHLERSLLSLPFGYVSDLLKEMSKCAKANYKPEIASRVAHFLIRIHHNQITHSIEFLHIVDELRTVLPTQTGFNIAGLRLLQMQLERRENKKLFDVQRADAERTAKKKKQRKRVKEVAFIKTPVS